MWSEGMAGDVCEGEGRGGRGRDVEEMRGRRQAKRPLY